MLNGPTVVKKKDKEEKEGEKRLIFTPALSRKANVTFPVALYSPIDDCFDFGHVFLTVQSGLCGGARTSTEHPWYA